MPVCVCVPLFSRLGDSEEDLQEAMDALEEMVEEEEQEAELEEVEDLLEYYLQRASAVQVREGREGGGGRDMHVFSSLESRQEAAFGGRGSGSEHALV